MKKAVKNLLALIVTLVMAIFIDLPLAVGQFLWFGFVWFIKANPTESDVAIASFLGIEPWWDEWEVW